MEYSRSLYTPYTPGGGSKPSSLARTFLLREKCREGASASRWRLAARRRRRRFKLAGAPLALQGASSFILLLHFHFWPKFWVPRTLFACNVQRGFASKHLFFAYPSIRKSISSACL